MRRWMMVICVVVVVIAALAVGGFALARTTSSSQTSQTSRTSRHRPATIAAFCATHTSRAGFWWSYGGQASFAQTIVAAARINHRQFEAVAGTLCGMLHRINTGHPVLVPDPNPRAPTRRQPIRRAQVRRAIRELERLPDAK